RGVGSCPRGRIAHAPDAQIVADALVKGDPADRRAAGPARVSGVGGGAAGAPSLRIRCKRGERRDGPGSCGAEIQSPVSVQVPNRLSVDRRTYRERPWGDVVVGDDAGRGG